MRRFLFPLIIFMILASLLGLGLRASRIEKAQELPSPLIGKLSPDFQLSLLGNSAKNIKPADLRNKVWVFNIWASWCVSCREELPVLLKYVRQSDVTWIGLDYKDEDAAAEQFLNDFGDPYDLSVRDLDGRVGLDFGVYGVPETFVIDRTGVVRKKFVGVLTDEMMQRELLPLVARLLQEPMKESSK